MHGMTEAEKTAFYGAFESTVKEALSIGGTDLHPAATHSAAAGVAAAGTLLAAHQLNKIRKDHKVGRKLRKEQPQTHHQLLAPKAKGGGQYY